MAYEPKTKQNEGSVTDFINNVEDEQKRKDSYVILEMMEKASGEKPKMWGPSIVGFGTYTITNSKGQESEWPRIGFSPRKQSLTLYVISYQEEDKKEEELLAKLGKHTTGKSCLYIKRLSDVDQQVLKEIIENSASR